MITSAVSASTPPSPLLSAFKTTPTYLRRMTSTRDQKINDNTPKMCSGVTAMFGPLDEKLVQLVHEIVPEAASLGFLFNPQNQSSTSRKQHVATAARVFHLTIIPLGAGSADETEALASRHPV